MNKLMMKAKAGVTLVELLVVILIVTILSVAMLPLLQPFVTEAQYAAEAIPVIGNLRTKIGLYQYEKTKLPQHVVSKVAVDANDPSKGTVNAPVVETWAYSPDVDTVSDSFQKAKFDLTSAASGKISYVAQVAGPDDASGNATQISTEHIGTVLDIGVEDLKGRRSRPAHYEYVVLRNGADYIYALGVFGDGNGLKLGTGYAVLEINLPSIRRKYVGTWKRYRPVEDSQVHFTTDTTLKDASDEKSTVGCPLEDLLYTTDWSNQSIADGEEPAVIANLRAYGWEF